VDEIAEVWRSESKGGRYEAALWKASGLEEMASHQADAARRSDGDNGDDENEVDNLQVGGVFARMVRMGLHNPEPWRARWHQPGHSPHASFRLACFRLACAR